ncbi:MAG: DUF3990 domain-containing protein [Muribaculaceae bacterium]|nr:DUF3990 domain-containing protein [Muribaculaceae bacterium]
MKLYHSSNVTVERPDTAHSRDFLDFGKGFYLTSLYDQAEKYALRFLRRQQNAWLNSYEFIYDPAKWKVLEFVAYDKEWLDFISKCRAGEDDSDYDIVIGGIADDKVIQTLDRYFSGELSAEETLGLLKYEKPNNQYCIRSKKMLDECLKHIESRQL